jgi:hypothetical protein
MLAYPVFSTLRREPLQPSYASWWAILRKQDKPRIERDLRALGGRHVVFVRYLPGITPEEEFVHNRAAIDEADVVWVRDTGEPRTRYGQRTPWLLNVTGGAPRLARIN